MERFILEIDCWMYDGLEEYLLSLPGVLKVVISDSMNFFVDVKYNSSITSSKLLKLEICFYLGILRMPSIISFQKIFKEKTDEYDIVIDDLCCKFCLRGMIEELFEIEGIESVTSNFHENHDYQKNVIIEVHYNPKIIEESEIRKLEIKFNEQQMERRN